MRHCHTENFEKGRTKKNRTTIDLPFIKILKGVELMRISSSSCLQVEKNEILHEGNHLKFSLLNLIAVTGRQSRGQKRTEEKL